MKLFCLISRESSINTCQSRFLKKAASDRGLEIVFIDPETFNYVHDEVEGGSLFIRIGTTDQTRYLEKTLLCSAHLTTFYQAPYMGIRDQADSFFSNKKSDLPIIKTVPDFLSNREALDDYVEYLGGFPLIIKVMGGSDGVGVMRVESPQSLLSIADYLRASGTSAILRQYIDHDKQGRLVVVGDRVVAGHVTFAGEDFRTNTVGVDRKRDAHVFSDEIQKLAVAAARSIRTDFAGVDILFEKNTGEALVGEVNSPCDFAFTQKITNIDIAGHMIDFLISKKEKTKLTQE